MTLLLDEEIEVAGGFNLSKENEGLITHDHPKSWKIKTNKQTNKQSTVHSSESKNKRLLAYMAKLPRFSRTKCNKYKQPSNDPMMPMIKRLIQTRGKDFFLHSWYRCLLLNFDRHIRVDSFNATPTHYMPNFCSWTQPMFNIVQPFSICFSCSFYNIFWFTPLTKPFRAHLSVIFSGPPVSCYLIPFGCHMLLKKLESPEHPSVSEASSRDPAWQSTLHQKSWKVYISLP